MKIESAQRWTAAIMCGIALGSLGTTGCQSSLGGQTLPSPFYLKDDVQYFAPGAEFKLSREAAAMKSYAADQELQGR